MGLHRYLLAYITSTMADQVNPFDSLIAEGKIFTEPENQYDSITILDFDMEMFRANTVSWCVTLFCGYYGIRDYIRGSNDDDIDDEITHGIYNMVDYACMLLFNRLRGILESYSIAARTARMNNRAPVNSRMEFPTWFSSLLSSIGPLDIPDGPVEMKILYATTAATAAHYGRNAPVNPNEPYWARLKNALIRAGVDFSPIDMHNIKGSAFTTVIVTTADKHWNVLSTLNHSHYENPDILRAVFCHNVDPDTAGFPFPDLSFTSQAIESNAIVTALTGARLEDIPAADPRLTTNRPVHGFFSVNAYGIYPAVAATAAGVPAQTAHAHIIGRGTTNYYRMFLARRIATTDLVRCLRFCFFKKN